MIGNRQQSPNEDNAKDLYRGNAINRGSPSLPRDCAWQSGGTRGTQSGWLCPLESRTS